MKRTWGFLYTACISGYTVVEHKKHRYIGFFREKSLSESLRAWESVCFGARIHGIYKKYAIISLVSNVPLGWDTTTDKYIDDGKKLMTQPRKLKQKIVLW